MAERLLPPPTNPDLAAGPGATAYRMRGREAGGRERRRRRRRGRGRRRRWCAAEDSSRLAGAEVFGGEFGCGRIWGEKLRNRRRRGARDAGGRSKGVVLPERDASRSLRFVQRGRLISVAEI